MTYPYYSNLPLPVRDAVSSASTTRPRLGSTGDVLSRIALAAINAYIKYLSDNPNDTKDTPVNPGYDANGFADNDLLALTDTERKLILALRAERETKAEFYRKANVAVPVNRESDEAYNRWLAARDKTAELRDALYLNYNNTKDATVNPYRDLLALTDTERKLILAVRAESETRAEYDQKAKVAEAANKASDEAFDKWREARCEVMELKDAL